MVKPEETDNLADILTDQQNNLYLVSIPRGICLEVLITPPRFLRIRESHRVTLCLASHHRILTQSGGVVALKGRVALAFKDRMMFVIIAFKGLMIHAHMGGVTFAHKDGVILAH
jgi:hypothetical protein